MESLAGREVVKYGRLTIKEFRKFVRTASQHYDFPTSAFCERVFQAVQDMNPFYVLASYFLYDNHPLKSLDATEARSHEIGTPMTSPLVPALESIFAGCPFHELIEIDPIERGIRAKGIAGRALLARAPHLTDALYESFYRGLLGPITSADQFVPDILARPNISGPAPIFIVGNPRTGTSLLQLLLSMDVEHNRSPTNWEFKTPASIFPDEERIRLGTPDPILKEMGYPRLREMQPEHPAEDIELFQSAGYIRGEIESGQELTCWNIMERDHVALICFHRLIVRLLECQERHQGQDDPKQWIFKDPVHMGSHMAAIIKVYPNARFIWTHRNFSDVVNSNFLVSPERAATPTIAEAHVANLLSNQRQGMAFRQTGQYLEIYDSPTEGFMLRTNNKNVPTESQEHRFSDVFLEDLHEDPVGQIQKLYEELDKPFTEEYEKAIQNWNTSTEKRDASKANKLDPFGFDDLYHLSRLMMENRDYFRRFPRTVPRNLAVVGLLDDYV